MNLTVIPILRTLYYFIRIVVGLKIQIIQSVVLTELLDWIIFHLLKPKLTFSWNQNVLFELTWNGPPVDKACYYDLAGRIKYFPLNIMV